MENRNYVLAIVLSLLIFVGWQFFYVNPKMERERLAAEQTAAQTSAPAADASAPVPSDAATGTPATPVAAEASGLTREAAIAATPRAAIQTPALSGSINLVGGRIDDLRLSGYHETLDINSPTIVLFSPSGVENAYYAEFGWTQAGNGGLVLPTASTLWTVEGNDRLTPSTPVTLAYDNGAGLIFRRTYSVDDQAMFTVADSVENTGASDATLYPYGLVARQGEPATSGYFVLHEGLIGVFGDEGLVEAKYKDMADEPRQTYADQTNGWLGFTDKYWASALIPVDMTYRGEFRRDTIANGVSYTGAYLGNGVSVAAGASASTTTRLFAGAKQVSVVDGYQESLGIDRFELLIDWGWFYFLTKPMFALIHWFYGFAGNFGVAILLATILIKTLFLPLANASYASMSRMKKVQPEMKAIQERFRDDRMEQQKQMMDLYKREKINPIAGCWPMLIQIPVFFSLYKVLFINIEMRHAPFFGWIRDLSAPDPTNFVNLFGLLPFDAPSVVIGGFHLTFGFWPLLMGITMFLQMKLNPAPTDKTQAMMFNYMPIVFTPLMAGFPAGLVIYWTWNNFLSILQQGFIMRRNGVKIELWDNLRALFSRKTKAE